MGPMSMVFTPGNGAHHPNGRQRGDLTAYVPVTWWVKAQGQSPTEHWVKRSSVFTAYAPDNGGAGTIEDPANIGALTFFDVNTTVWFPVLWGPSSPAWVLPEHDVTTLLALPKLPRGDQYSERNGC